MQRPTFRARHLLLPCLLMILAACGEGHDAQPSAQSADGTALPVPEAVRGTITGMPNAPGPGALSAVPGNPTPDTPIADDQRLDRLPAPPPVTSDASGMMPDDSVAASNHSTTRDEPTTSDAVDVVRAYYAAINAGRYSRAYGLWSGNGDASGQSPQQFAAGFADTASVAIEFEPPGRVEPAAGSRFIDIPVSIAATHEDGNISRYLGIYTLRRAVVDGASTEQRAWRIMSADIREVAQ